MSRSNPAYSGPALLQPEVLATFANVVQLALGYCKKCKYPLFYWKIDLYICRVHEQNGGLFIRLLLLCKTMVDSLSTKAACI